MPNKPKTPTRAIRVEDRLWQRAQARAAEKGETVSDAVRRFLERYAK
jgi:antitoxin component of RelBE/YafQ-DinJ toxin-antitoxin module